MNTIQVTKQALKGISTTQQLTRNPLDFALDTLVRFIVRMLIPIPVASELIVYFKVPILALLFGTILFFITVLIIMTLLFTPLSSVSSFSNLLTGILSPINTVPLLR